MEISEALIAAAVMMVPIVAIVGGVTAGILKSNSKRRLIELAQRERIAAIERGIDPDKLPALHVALDKGDNGSMSFEQRQLRRSQNLIIWGLALLGFGVALTFGIGLVEDNWKEGGPALMFAGVGAALLIGGRMVRPSPEDLRRESPRTPPSPGL